MICYKDRSFCANETHAIDCTRQITEQEIEEAKTLGLPIAYGHYC